MQWLTLGVGSCWLKVEVWPDVGCHAGPFGCVAEGVEKATMRRLTDRAPTRGCPQPERAGVICVRTNVRCHKAPYSSVRATARAALPVQVIDCCAPPRAKCCCTYCAAPFLSDSHPIALTLHRAPRRRCPRPPRASSAPYSDSLVWRTPRRRPGCCCRLGRSWLPSRRRPSWQSTGSWDAPPRYTPMGN